MSSALRHLFICNTIHFGYKLIFWFSIRFYFLLLSVNLSTMRINMRLSRWKVCLILCFILSIDVDVDKPDEKSIMTYVAQFLKHHPDRKRSDLDGQQDEEVTSCHLCLCLQMPSIVLPLLVCEAPVTGVDVTTSLLYLFWTLNCRYWSSDNFSWLVRAMIFSTGHHPRYSAAKNPVDNI